MMSALVDHLRSGQIASLAEQAAHLATLDVVATAGRPAILAALAEQVDQMLLVVTSTYREAEQLTESISTLIDPDRVCYYPAWETLPHERLSPRFDTVGKRLQIARKLTEGDSLSVVIAPIRSLLQPQVADLGQICPVEIEVGKDYEISQLSQDLTAAAYTRVDLVERRGEYAVRGGIVDLFIPTADHPVRIDFFGDEIESITEFAVADQLSTDRRLDKVVAQPCRELLLNDDVRAKADALIEDHPHLAEILEKIAQGQPCEGMEALIPALVDRLELLVDIVPDKTLVILLDPELVLTRADELVATSKEFLQAGWAAAAQGGKAPIDLKRSAYRTVADVRLRAMERGLHWWTISAFNAGEQVEANDAISTDSLIARMVIDSHTMPNAHGDSHVFIEQIRSDNASGKTVVLSAEGSGPARRMVEMLQEADIPAVLCHDDLAPRGVISVIISGLRHGFSLDDPSISLYTAADLTGHAAVRSQRKMPAKRRSQIVPLELVAGDLLVHQQHGVGRYVEMMTRTVAGATREYLVIEYAPSKRGHPGDRLYVPVEQLDEVTRYVGGDNPHLDKMGGADWKARKAKARKAVREIAEGLIKLYAARQASQGHAFAPDTPWQRELEDAFSYTETPDQLAAINEVKADMEKVVPMDRLICGDVGYGKTEIAVRAAFKAVQDGKQVAVLVPTTLLVQQHAQTFINRYAGFPVTVASLSRFQTASETQRILDGLASGRIDIVIGTHGLFASRVHFKDLGLVIVDEEQRFGVEHKEALKKLKVNVDVLSMSATPIPRTLEMAVTGIREMSTIATPPEERHPVLTFVGAYDRGQVSAAIRRELAREGQVFFIHNRVTDIDKIAAQLREDVPEARVMTAHGQMSERSLEQVMIEFAERRADVLVCTTIVESGIDISTANTLIVDRAERMGLSQLHQLRGRVGRGRERGYAYFLYPPDKPLTATAHDRLAALAAHTDLGAGMAIAMKDLEIRGAGNLLGAEQSGHIADVGFDLYIRMVGEAVAAYRGQSVIEELPQMRIELPIEAHLPVDYVESERLRLEIYARLAEVRDEADLVALREELIDRYGPIPDSAAMLIDVARFRLACRHAGITEVIAQGNTIKFAPVDQRVLPDGRLVDLEESRQLRLGRLYPRSVIKKATNSVLIPRPYSSGIPARPYEGRDMLEWASAVLKAVFTP